MSLIEGCSDVSSEKTFYENADKYWKGISPTVNGMLGGYSHICSVDIQESKKFLCPYLQGPNPKVNRGRALDCGAGIGRISKLFLLHNFDSVDLLEQNEAFLERAKSYLGSEQSARVGEFICCGIQDVTLKDDYYDVIWIQWVTGHLTDIHFVEFLKKCQRSIKSNGLIVIKENVSSETVEWDEVDSSVTRSYDDITNIFKKAGLRIVKETHQTNFPVEIYRVFMFALCPGRPVS